MKTEKRKPYETPSVGVVETTCAVIAASNVTLGAQSDDNDWLQLDDAAWSGLTLDKNGTSKMDDAVWNR